MIPAQQRTRAVLRYAGFIVFFLALSVRLAYIFTGRTYLTVETPESVQMARNIAAGKGFSSPFGGDTGPSAHLAPAYPWFLSLIYRFTEDPARQMTVEVITAVTSSLMYSCFPLLSAELGLGLLPGIIGAMIGAILPVRLWVETKGTWEMHWLAFALVLMVLAIRRWFVAPTAGRREAVWLGLFCGVAFLVGPNLLPVIGVWFLVALWETPAPIRGSTGRLALVVLCTAAVVGPWIVRCYTQVGVLGWVRGNLGLELAISNNDQAKPRGGDNLVFGVSHHPFVNEAERKYLGEIGEAEYNRRRMTEAVAWIRANPSRFLALTRTRMAEFWFPKMNHRLKELALWSLTVLAWFGTFWTFRRLPAAALWSAAVFLFYPLMYYLVQVDVRYPYPIYPFILLNVGVLTAAVLRFLLASRVAALLPNESS